MIWTSVAITVFVLLIGSALLAGYKARRVSQTSYEAVVALGDVAKAASELAQVDARTAVSMGGSVKSWAEETNPTIRRAKLMGYESWRNSVILPTQNKMRAAYERYEKSTRLLIEIFAMHPYKLWVRDMSDRRRARKGKNYTDHAHLIDHHHHYHDEYRPKELPSGQN